MKCGHKMPLLQMYPLSPLLLIPAPPIYRFLKVWTARFPAFFKLCSNRTIQYTYLILFCSKAKSILTIPYISVKNKFKIDRFVKKIDSFARVER